MGPDLNKGRAHSRCMLPNRSGESRDTVYARCVRWRRRPARQAPSCPHCSRPVHVPSERIKRKTHFRTEQSQGALAARGESVWAETFTGLRVDRFERLLRAVREPDGNGSGGGRPWCLPLADRVVLVAVMKTWKILRDCRQRGDDLHHAVRAVVTMHNLALTRCNTL